jgi:hypothetical protein
VLEANFRPRSEYERRRISALGGRLVEVHCDCPLEVAARRCADRAASCHPVHVVTTLSADFMSEFEQPVGLGELIMVDTMVRVDVLRLASEVRKRLASSVWRGRDAFSGRVGVPPP